MPTVTYTNQAALLAGHKLGNIQEKLRQSLQRLSSGNRMASAEQDPGGAAVSLKLGAELRRSQASQNNVQNALSFLQTQQGVFEIATGTLARMSELATLAQDITKSASDLQAYNAEFQKLQQQLQTLPRLHAYQLAMDGFVLLPYALLSAPF